MMFFKKRFLSVLLVSSFMLITETGFSHSGATGVVKQRMDIMKQFKKDIRIIRKVMQAGSIENRQRVVDAGERIESGAKQLVDLFPVNSNPHPSEADDVIWQQWDQFNGFIRQLSDQADLLQRTTESKDTVSMQAAYRKLNRSCKQCHKQFRQ